MYVIYICRMLVICACISVHVLYLLQTGVTFVIWAYGDADPDANGAPYHGVTRGAKQLGLITESVPVGK